MAIPLTTNSSIQNITPQQTGSANQRTMNSEQFLTFSVSPTQQVMLATKQLVEILSLSLGQITSIADVATSVMGVCNWRGEVLWVIDLADLMGFEPMYGGGYTQVNANVILARSQGMVVGLAVAKVGQMLWCEADQILPAPATFAQSEMSRFLRGYWLNQTGQKSETFLTLNADVIVNAYQ
jgi:positive phototaxis protein PixI